MMLQSVEVSKTAMILRVCTASLLFMLCSGEGFDWCSITCEMNSQVYKHTMCLYKEGGNDSCNQGYKRGVTKEEKQLLVDLHNQLRAKVARGEETRGPQPPAADMSRLVWDEELATVAQRWADQCDLPEDKHHDDCRSASDNVQVGQNVAQQRGSGITVDRSSMIKQMVESWYDEVKNMDPGSVKEFRHVTGPATGHYTQLVWGATSRVGCGLTLKDQKEVHIKLVCNYKKAGNFLGLPIYTVGEPASKCAEKSKDYPALCEPKEKGDKELGNPPQPPLPSISSPSPFLLPPPLYSESDLVSEDAISGSTNTLSSSSRRSLIRSSKRNRWDQ